MITRWESIGNHENMTGRRRRTVTVPEVWLRGAPGITQVLFGARVRRRSARQDLDDARFCGGKLARRITLQPARLFPEDSNGGVVTLTG